MKKRTVITLILLNFLCINLFSQGYQLKVKVKGIKENEKIILGHHFTKNLFPDDTGVVDKNGWAIIEGKQPLPGGMYFLYLPTKTYFDFLIDKNQNFTIENDTSDLLRNLKFTNCPENSAFIDFQIKMVDMQRKSKNLHEERAKTSDPKRIAEIDKQISSFDLDYLDRVDKIIKENPNWFLSKFLKATMDVKVPKEITVDMQKYYYYRNHYWDNFDVSDGRLLRTPIYENKINFFLDKVIPQMPDTIIKEVDWLISKSRSSKELFRYMLVSLFNKYATSQVMTSENIYVHIAEKYYIPEADWSDKQFIKDLTSKVKKKKYCLIGGEASEIKIQTLFSDSVQINAIQKLIPDFKNEGLKIEKDSAKMTKQERINNLAVVLEKFMSNFKGFVSTNQSKAKFTILWFWDPTCSHCTVETPKFYKCWKDTLRAKGVQVYSIYMTKDIEHWANFSNHIDDWLKFIKKHKMFEWINGWNPFDLYREHYDISSSPVLYLLDEERKIIAKRIGYEQAKEIILNYLKDEEKEKKK